MSFFSGMFRSMLSSLIVSMLFALVGVCLFIGDFPPSVSKFKKVFGEYKSLIQLKQNIGIQGHSLSDEQLVTALETGKDLQMQKLGKSRGIAKVQNYQDYEKQVEQIGQAERVPQAAVSPNAQVADVPSSKAEIPQEWQRQFYDLKAEVFRLNQRVIELESRKTQ